VRPRLLVVAGGALLLAMAPAAPAVAHGLVGRTDLPIPDWLFAWGAAAVLVVSFAALAVAWPVPRLQTHGLRPLPATLSRVLTSRAVDVLCGAVGVLLLIVTVLSGLSGTGTVSDNFAPNFVYVAFWLGLVPLSVLFGDVFRAFNPWRAIGRLLGWYWNPPGFERPAVMPYPSWLGHWPAVAGLLAFGWLELVSPRGDHPVAIAIAALVYTVLTLTAMALFGVETWCRRGEAFSVYFGLFARLSVFERRADGRICLRPPLSGLPRWSGGPGAVAVLATMVGIVSFDGLSAGKPFNDTIAGVLTFLRDRLGTGPVHALQLVFAVALVGMCLLAAGFYLLGVRGAARAERGHSAGELAQSFVHTLVPIALAYVAAHYASLLLLQGQVFGSLVSDPAGQGWDLFGTAGWAIDYGFIGATAFWYMQVGFVIAGHVAALTLAHDRALAVFSDAKAAVRSQFWLLGVMVGYTTLALWLLAQAREG
jgi:hypothetical protein